MKKFAWLGIILLGIIILLGGIVSFGKIAFGNRFDAGVAALKAAGEPTTLAELVGDPIPNHLNAAVPYLDIQAQIESRTYEADLKTIDEFASNKGPVTPEMWASAEQALARTMPLRRLLDDALARPKCRFDVNMRDPVSTLYPQMPAIRRMTRWLKVSALVNARNGRMDQAADDMVAQVGIVQSLKDEPAMIHHLCRMALLAIAVRTVTDTAEIGAFSDDQARMVFDALGSFDFAESYRQAWRGETVVFLHYSDPKNLQYVLASASHSATGSTSPGMALGKPFGWLYTQTAMKGDLAVFIGLASKARDGAGLSFSDAKAQGLLSDPTGLPSYAVLTGTLIPVLTHAGLKRYSVEADVSRARVFLALQAYKARFGGYPASMAELKSKLGWKLPMDPFSEKDFIYKKQPKGFILYSVGPDMKDDGGRVLLPKVESLADKGDVVLTWEK